MTDSVLSEQSVILPDSLPESPEIASPVQGVLVVQPGNRGKLWQGKPENWKASTGRPKDELRAKMLELGVTKGLPLLESIIAGKVEGASIDHQLKATEQAMKYGLGTIKDVSVENIRDRMTKTLEVIRAHCSPEQAESIVSELRGIWV